MLNKSFLFCRSQRKYKININASSMNMPYTTLTFINILRIFLCAVSVNWLFIVDLFTLDAFTNRNICKIYPTLNKVGQLIPTTFMSMIFKPEMKLSAIKTAKQHILKFYIIHSDFPKTKNLLFLFRYALYDLTVSYKQANAKIKQEMTAIMYLHIK